LGFRPSHGGNPSEQPIKLHVVRDDSTVELSHNFLDGRLLRSMVFCKQVNWFRCLDEQMFSRNALLYLSVSFLTDTLCAQNSVKAPPVLRKALVQCMIRLG
jgi:hypothetical protein